MKKEQIYVTIDDEEKRLRAIEILDKAGEKTFTSSELRNRNHWNKQLEFFDDVWLLSGDALKTKTQITLDQLESLLIPNYQVKDVILSIDELKQQAEKLGFELVEKPYEPKVGDFGYFWDFNENSNNLGFITDIQIAPYRFVRNANTPFTNFRKLTESEKQKIQESW
jgi:hypothetical protein